MNKIIVIGCTRPKHAPSSSEELMQDTMHQANGLQKCLERVSPPHVWGRLDPPLKPHPATKVLRLGQNWTKLDTKRESLARGFEQVNRALSKWAVCWHTHTPQSYSVSRKEFLRS